MAMRKNLGPQLSSWVLNLLVGDIVADKAGRERVMTAVFMVNKVFGQVHVRLAEVQHPVQPTFFTRA
jgi:hypothetical protein